VGLNLLSQYLEAFVLPAITRGREFSSFSPESCVVLSKNAFLEGLFGSCPPLSGFFFPVVLVGRKRNKRAVGSSVLGQVFEYLSSRYQSPWQKSRSRLHFFMGTCQEFFLHQFFALFLLDYKIVFI
jgi:hypothetical protein